MSIVPQKYQFIVDNLSIITLERISLTSIKISFRLLTDDQVILWWTYGLGQGYNCTFNPEPNIWAGETAWDLQILKNTEHKVEIIIDFGDAHPLLNIGFQILEGP